MITPEFAVEFREALDDAKGLPPIEGFQKRLAVVAKHNMSYTYEGTADDFLVHPENRSRPMLTPSKCHKVGDAVHDAGTDLKQLNAAFAFELSKTKKRRDVQIKKNMELVARDDDLMAKVNGKEHFITVGTSHFTQFNQLAMLAGKTPVNSLQDKAGRIDLAKLKRNANYKTLLEKSVLGQYLSPNWTTSFQSL